MTGQLDQISQAIGSLQATAESQARNSDNIWHELSDMKEMMRRCLAGQERLIEQASNLQKQVEENKTTIDKKLKEDVMPVVEQVKTMRNRGIGALGVVGFAATALGYKIDAIIAWATK